jgi:type IV pilus assembly protein PilV
MLLEAMVGILIFSIGILSVVALQTTAIKVQADAKYRADAAYLSNRIIGTIWGDRANIANYAHRTSAGGTSCDPSGTDSAAANVTTWLAQVAATLPGATSQYQQIKIDTASSNQVTVTICWKTPQETTWRNHRTVTYVN